MEDIVAGNEDNKQGQITKGILSHGKELGIYPKSKWEVFYGLSLGQENDLLRFTVRKITLMAVWKLELADRTKLHQNGGLQGECRKKTKQIRKL